MLDKWEQSVLIVDEANDVSYCVGNKGKNHAARFRSPNGIVSNTLNTDAFSTIIVCLESNFYQAQHKANIK